MGVITLVIPRGRDRNWHSALGQALERQGHRVQVVEGAATTAPAGLDLVLLAESKILRKQTWLAGPGAVATTDSVERSDLTINLAGKTMGSQPALHFLSDPGADALSHWAGQVAAGTLPDIEIYEGQVCIARGQPMVDRRVFIGPDLEDVLARAITLMVKTVAQRLSGPLPSAGTTDQQDAPNFITAYIGSALPRIIREIVRRRRFHKAHWKVGYRLIDGLGVAETQSLAGAPWQIIEDDGQRFYADPFPFVWQGQNYIFVEELEHAVGKAIISVSRLDAQGRASRPKPVLIEPHHLSYPQVFARDGEVWMMPEGSAGLELVLYRAVTFPDVWERHQVLIAGRALSDATLIDAGDRLWLIATDATDGGSTSDCMVAYHAPTLLGPWTAFAQNPIMIDRKRARPGGAAVRSGGRIYLPIQDGTLGYGGGLGMSEVVALSPEHIAFADPVSIETEGFWPYPRIHTLNRHERLEVIDGIADVRRR